MSDRNTARDDDIVPEQPHCFEAERDCIGGMLLESPSAGEGAARELRAEVFGVVSPSQFFHAYHRRIAEAMFDLHQAGGSVDCTTVIEELRRRGTLEEAGGEQHIVAIEGHGFTRRATAEYAHIIRDRARDRELIRAGRQLEAAGFAQYEDPSEAVERARDIFNRATDCLTPAEIPEPRSLAQVKHESAGLSWAWKGRLVYGHLNVIAAPNGAGKSWTMLDILRCMTTGCDWPDGTQGSDTPERALWLDYELMEEATADRAEAMGLDMQSIFVQGYGPLPYLSDPKSFDVIRSWLVKLEARVLVIDSWRRACPTIDVEGSSFDAMAVVNPLGELIRDFGLLAIVGCHVRKIREKVAEGDRWTTSIDDLRGTGAFADAARCVMGIDKPSASDPTRRLTALKGSFDGDVDDLGFVIGDEGLTWTDAPRRQRESPASSLAREAILVCLQPQPLPYSQLKAEVARHGTFSEGTFLNVLKKVAVKGADGRWGLLSPHSAD